MILNREPLNKWFGYTRRERRSSSLLLIILIIVIILRYSLPDRNNSVEYLASGFSYLEEKNNIDSWDTSDDVNLFPVDLNRASYDTLLKLGLTSVEANTLINYRNKGGKFLKGEDVKKVFMIDQRKAERLIPYVKVATDVKQNRITDYHLQHKVIVEINSCDSASLVRLPGIGPVLSARIIKYRRLLGGYVRINQLKEVYGLPEETYHLIEGSLIVDTTTIRRININTADYSELDRHPYFENFEIKAILKYRELKGLITGLTVLIDNNLITSEKANKVGPYLEF